MCQTGFSSVIRINKIVFKDRFLEILVRIKILQNGFRVNRDLDSKDSSDLLPGLGLCFRDLTQFIVKPGIEFQGVLYRNRGCGGSRKISNFRNGQ